MSRKLVQKHQGQSNNTGVKEIKNSSLSLAWFSSWRPYRCYCHGTYWKYTSKDL